MAKAFLDPALLSRVLVGHAASYPVAFAWAVAALPLVVATLGAQGLEGGERAVTLAITWRALAAFGVAYVVAHLVALPWWVRPTRATRRLFAGAVVSLTLAAVVIAAVAWARLLRS